MGYNDPLCFVLENEDGEEMDVEAVGSFAYREKEYAVLGRKEEGHEHEVFLMKIHAGENDEIILEPIENEEEYAIISKVFEDVFRSDRPQEEYDLVDMYDQEALEHMIEEEYCYQDKDGNLFILDDMGEPVYLDENGEEIHPESATEAEAVAEAETEIIPETVPEDEKKLSDEEKSSESEETDHE